MPARAAMAEAGSRPPSDDAAMAPLALDLVTDRDTREPVPASTIAALKKELMARGLLPFSADNRIHVVPPCTVTTEEVLRALAIYDEAFTAVAG